MYRFKCNCNKELSVSVVVPNIRCPYCKRDYMWWNNEYREYEIATLVDSFTPREISGVGLYNKLRRGLIRCKMRD